MTSRRDFLQLSFCAISVNLPGTAAVDSSDPWNAAELIEPAKLAEWVSRGDKSLQVVCVAFPALYKQRHISGAVFAGPGGKPEGIATLRATLEKLIQSEPVILYCGCCPMQDCPNIRPAYSTAKGLGFKKLQVLNLPNNFHTDWTAKGYPVA
jgi:thiosulfate/3-mercaptopyruvate sulfurtransferase